MTKREYRELIAVRCQIPEAGLSYPCRLAIEGRVTWTGAGVGLGTLLVSAVVGYAIAPQELG